MKYLYILLLGLIIYYIISRFYEKYTENFDPSLVPVSSIVTLAKVAQKLVDGNGTLTNPGNLQIGTPSAVGNLLVTGNTIVTGGLANIGVTQLGNTLGVTGATNLSSTLGVAGATTLSSTLGVTGATTIGTTGTPAATNNLTVNGSTKINGDVTLPSHILSTSADKNYFYLNNKNNTNVLSIGQAGDTYITGATTIGTTANNAKLFVNGDVNIGPSNVAAPGHIYGGDGTMRFSFVNGGDTFINSPNNFNFWHQTNGNIANIDKSGNMTVNGNLTYKGNLNGKYYFMSQPVLCDGGSGFQTQIYPGNLPKGIFKVEGIRIGTGVDSAPRTNYTGGTTSYLTKMTREDIYNPIGIINTLASSIYVNGQYSISTFNNMLYCNAEGNNSNSWYIFQVTQLI